MQATVPLPENIFPAQLLQAAIDHFGTEMLGVALLRQRIAGERPAAGLDRSSAELLHPCEKAQAGAYRLPKRNSEFLLGRIAAKLALAELWTAKHIHRSLSSVEIVNDSTGRPLVKVHPDQGEHSPPPAEISISHGGDYGAALAADVPCGIDLQEQKDTLIRVLDKYCTAEEARILGDCLPEMAPVVQLSLLWTAKEAAKKACSSRWMPGFLDLRLDSPVTRQESCYLLNLTVARAPEKLLSHRLTALATTFNQYGLAVCILNEARENAGTAGS